MSKIIKVESCGQCPYNRYSALLCRTVCGHEDNDCETIKDFNSILKTCPLPNGDSESINPCYQCEYREPDEREYINICLLDESQECIRG